MQSVNTPEELTEAKIAIYLMRGIDPDAVINVSTKLETRAKIEELLESRAIESYDYELHGVNYTNVPSIDPETHKKLSEAAKKSHFGQPRMAGLRHSK